MTMTSKTFYKFSRKLSPEERTRIAILCVMELNMGGWWKEWADKWLQDTNCEGIRMKGKKYEAEFWMEDSSVKYSRGDFRGAAAAAAYCEGQCFTGMIEGQDWAIPKKGGVGFAEVAVALALRHIGAGGERSRILSILAANDCDCKEGNNEGSGDA